MQMSMELAMSFMAGSPLVARTGYNKASGHCKKERGFRCMQPEGFGPGGVA